MQIGNLSYKMGFLVTKWESWLQNKIFAYKKGFLAFKWESRFAIHRNLPCYVNIFVQCIEFFVQMTYNISEKERDIMAKSNTSNISIRMDSNLKAAAEELYEELGMNLSTAFNIFVRQSLRERGIPFKITEGTPNKEIVSAMLEAERIAKNPNVKGYRDVDELFADLDK
jgi:DNA-damage-inducible protein J